MTAAYARPAGFRTHVLIAGAVALLVGLADLLAVHFSSDIANWCALIRSA